MEMDASAAKRPERNRLVTAAARSLLGAHAAMAALADRLGPRKKAVGEGGADILLTGTFHSGNWIVSHLKPLAASKECRRIRVVTAFPIPRIDKVETVPPGRLLSRFLGEVPARLLTFASAALRSRPHAVGGFHLLMNGLAASLLARAAGGRSIYFCVGGPAEVQGGGILSENRLFERLGSPDPRIESALLRAAAKFDLVVTMGSRAKSFFRENGVTGEVRVIPGGVDALRSGAGEEFPGWDVIYVGRIVPVKQVDLLLRAMALVRRELPRTRAVIVGGGPMLREMEALAAELGLGDAVEFAGQREDVAPFLHRSKLFVLTSKTEGLSLGLMEAMAAGLPAVVPDVGDLADLVRDGENGYLVGEPSPERFAERIASILRDEPLRRGFGEAARASMEAHRTENAARQWDSVLASWRNGKGAECAG